MARTVRHDAQDAARTLRRVLAEVTAGRLEAGGSRGVALRRRLEGAATALEAVGDGSVGRRSSG